MAAAEFRKKNDSAQTAQFDARAEGEDAEVQGTERPGVWSMAVVHQYYRREFELAPRILRDLRPGQDERARRAADWFGTTLKMMHHHHVTEDDLMYPLLEGRVPQLILDRMEVQHQQVAAGVDQVEALLAQWDAEPASTEALAAAFDELLPVLIEHLDAEEQEVMPLVADLLSVKEYERQGTSGNQSLDPTTLMMAFGAMIEQAGEFEAAVMLSHPPEHVRAAWYAHGADDHAALMALLRGGLQPVARVGVPATPAVRV